jgi:ribosome-associated protein
VLEFDLKGEEWIPLNTLLKLLSIVGTGGEAKIRIINGEVQVNKVIELQIRKKLRIGDVISIGESTIRIIDTSIE